jgi:NAD(P)H-dependent FMN reductase
MRRPSYTVALAEAFAATLRSHGVHAVHWALRDRPLPAAGATWHDAAAAEFAAAAAAADALALVSPLYHGSYSGVLKNALDHLRREDVEYRPVALLSHGGDRSTQPADQLRPVVRAIGGLALPAQLATRASDFATRGERYELVAPTAVERLERVARELAVFAGESARLRALLVQPAPAAAQEPADERPVRRLAFLLPAAAE